MTATGLLHTGVESLASSDPEADLATRKITLLVCIPDAKLDCIVLWPRALYNQVLHTCNGSYE